MKMIDRFMSFINEVYRYKNTKNHIAKWKLKHRIYEIKEELKNKEKFTKEDIRSLCWIVKFGQSRWSDDFKLPDGFDIIHTDIVCMIGYYANDISYKLTIDDEITIFIKGIKIPIASTHTYWRNAISSNTMDVNDNFIYHTLKTLFHYIIPYIMDRFYKEEMNKS